jgi:hypothetical protein
MASTDSDKYSNLLGCGIMASGSYTEVEYLTHYPKIVGSNTTAGEKEIVLLTLIKSYETLFSSSLALLQNKLDRFLWEKF